MEVGYGSSGKQLFQGGEAWLVLGVWKALDSSWERHKNECEAKAGKVVKEYAGKKLERHATNLSRQQSGRE